MRRYEVVCVLAPGLSEDEVDQQIELFSKSGAEKGAEVLGVEKWGKRRLAYPVNKHNEAYFAIFTLQEEGGAAVAELERRFRVNDAVIRFLSVRTDLEIKRFEKVEKKRELKRKRRIKKQPEESGEVITERE